MKIVKENMNIENKLDILKTVRKVEAPDSLYDAIIERVNREKTSIISMKWVTAAAAALVLFLATDAYLISQSRQSPDMSTDISALIPSQNNYLYNE